MLTRFALTATLLTAGCPAAPTPAPAEMAPVQRAQPVSARSSPQSPVASAVTSLVNQLGDAEGNEGRIAALQSTPRQAVRELVTRLRVVDDSSEVQVSWCLRALEAITDRAFTATTRTPLTEHQAQCVGQDSEMAFWVHRMSSALTAVAPEDVQRAIIRQWREWVAANADTFAPQSGVPLYTYPVG